MQDYKTGLETGDDKLLYRIEDAVRCLDLSNANPVIKTEVGRETAIFLKEVIDRIIVLDYELVPDSSEISRWRLKDTEITIYKISDPTSEQNGEFLFTPGTVSRAARDYRTVKSLPYLEGSGKGAGFNDPLFEEMVPLWAKEKNLGLSNWQWIGLLLVIIGGLIVKIVAEFGVIILMKLTVHRKNSIRHQLLQALEKPIGLVFATALWFVSIYFLKLDGVPLAVTNVVVKIVFSVSVIWACFNLANVLTKFLERVTEKTASEMDDQLVPLISKALRVFIVVFGILMTIQSLGFNIMSIMAGLGLGGLAFALAAKDTAANLFGSIMILIDRPFKVGDWVRASSSEGTVEEIGFRSTRIRTFYNSLVSVPNMEMATTTIDNMGARKFRRENITLGVTYDTRTDQIEAFMEGIKKIILDNPYTNKENFHVAFRGFGDSSLNIMVYYFVEVKDWSDELKAKQDINLKVLQLAESLDVSFAFPSQSVYLEKMPTNNEAVQ
tara:strand:- start:3431 stop:4915 length:1485 start_codon:yes stop_codon:yes gene_type:complete